MTSGNAFLRWGVRWRLPFLLLLAILAIHSFSTFGVFVQSDDLKWVQRTAADARQPWNAFVTPLFGDYYRPIPHLVWLANYYLWGFDFAGHQMMFILMWLAGVCLVYAVGCRIGGRVCGFAAAALVGLNYVYLLIASWKSWYTTLTEFVAVLACIWFTLKWMETRRTRYAVAAAALAVAATLSRELAPLVLSAIALAGLVLPKFRAAEAKSRRRAVIGLAVWAAVTAAVLLALPSYRQMAGALLKHAQEPATASGLSAAVVAKADGARGAPGEYVWTRFVKHTQSMFEQGGVSRYLVLFAALFGFLRLRRERSALAKRYHRILLGGLVLGVVFFALPWAVGAIPGPVGEKVKAVSANYAQPVAAGILMLLFCAVAFAGDRTDRMLGAWFVASFPPILFLEHWSGAYHLLAFTALGLFTARAIAAFAQDEFLPALARLRGKAPADPEDDARYGLVAFVAVLLISQAWTLGTSLRMARAVIQKRATDGRALESQVNRAVEGVRKSAAPDRSVWVASEPYAELAGLMLQEEHGFKVRRLDRAGWVGLRTFDADLRVYTDAVRYDDALFAQFNQFRNAGFEQAEAGLTRSTIARSGGWSLASAEVDATARNCVMDCGPFAHPKGVGYVFGGFMRREAESAALVRMSFRTDAAAAYLRATPPIAQAKPEWELVWECAAPPADAGGFVLRVLDADHVRNGRILVDDVFLCPVEPLIRAARAAPIR